MRHSRSTVVVLFFTACLGFSGCGEPSLDSPQYGEIIHDVPARLDKPYPLPELEPPLTAPAPDPLPAGNSSVAPEPAAK